MTADLVATLRLDAGSARQLAGLQARLAAAGLFAAVRRAGLGPRLLLGHLPMQSPEEALPPLRRLAAACAGPQPLALPMLSVMPARQGGTVALQAAPGDQPLDGTLAALSAVLPALGLPQLELARGLTAPLLGGAMPLLLDATALRWRVEAVELLHWPDGATRPQPWRAIRFGIGWQEAVNAE